MSDDNRTWRGDFTDADFETEAARLTRERDDARAEVERLHRAHQAACDGGDLLRAEVERLRAVLKIAAVYVRYCCDEWHLTRDREKALRDLTEIRAALNDEKAGE